MATTTTTTTPNNHGQLIRDLLDGRGVEYRYIVHEETPTSEDSARARGEDLSTGGKALVLRHRDAPKKKKGDDDDDDEEEEEDSSSAGGFAVFVLSASRKLNSKAIRKEFGSKNGVRFATKEELSDLTGGLVPGSVPPFGRPIIDMDLFVDASIIEENEKIAFNCGSLTESIVMSRKDYVDVAAPTGVFPFSK